MTDSAALVVIASYLRPEEAGMLQGLLASAGIAATVRDDMLSSIHPFLQPAIGGAKLAVPAPDAERAREIVRSAGVLPGLDGQDPCEIPEDEWSRTPAAEPAPEPARSAPSWRRAVVAAPLVFALVLALLRCGAGAAER